MRVRHEWDPLVLEHHLVVELGKWIFSELARLDYAVREEIVRLANLKNVSDRVSIPAINAAQDAVARNERLAGSVESDETGYVRHRHWRCQTGATSRSVSVTNSSGMLKSRPSTSRSHMN